MAFRYLPLGSSLQEPKKIILGTIVPKFFVFLFNDKSASI